MSHRIAPVVPPYSPAVKVALEKWMPPGSPLEPLVLFRTLARHELLNERMRPLGAALLGKGLLPLRVRELVILRATARCHSEYEWGVHVTAFAAAVGLDEEAVRATVLRSAREVAASDHEDDHVLCFVDELHDTGTVSDRTWSLLAARFDEASLLELSVLTGFYHLISFVTNSAALAPEPWAARFPSVSERG